MSGKFCNFVKIYLMKKLFILLTLALGAVPAFAQDLITKKDGTDIQAKVLEVTVRDVRYKAWNNLEGPEFVLPAYDILIIRFENGTNHVFNVVSPGYGLNSGFYTSDLSMLGESGLRYKSLKNYYNREDYAFLQHPRYGLGMPWLNLIFPGLSQYCMDEPGLASGSSGCRCPGIGRHHCQWGLLHCERIPRGQGQEPLHRRPFPVSPCLFRVAFAVHELCVHALRRAYGSGCRG